MSKVLFCVMFFLFACHAVLAATTATESPETFIRQLYKEYMADYVKNAYWFDKPAKMSRYFAPKLIDLFMRDEACKEVTREVCAIDSDPIIDAQDYNEKYPYSLTVTKIGEKAPVRLKVVFSDSMTHSGGGDQRTIYYILQKADGHWAISDISYPDGRSLARELEGYKPNFDNIDGFIRFMEKTSKSTEYRKARIVRRQGKKHYVLFTLESGMNYRQHLAALQSMDGGYLTFVDEIVVGGRGERGVEKVNVVNGGVVLETKEYGPRDAMCCPSVPGKMTVRVKKGKLVKE